MSKDKDICFKFLYLPFLISGDISFQYSGTWFHPSTECLPNSCPHPPSQKRKKIESPFPSCPLFPPLITDHILTKRVFVIAFRQILSKIWHSFSAAQSRLIWKGLLGLNCLKQCPKGSNISVIKFVLSSLKHILVHMFTSITSFLQLLNCYVTRATQTDLV